MIPIASEIDALIDRALAEDLHGGDPTTDTLIPGDLSGRAVVVAKAAGILAGVDVCIAVFRRVDPTVEARALLADGSSLTAIDGGHEGDVIAEIEGSVSSILRAERTALNFLQHMSGVATQTRRYVVAVDGHEVQILDTRKTLPGLRSLQKYAVVVGGGKNHRRSLGDGILIKDNHIVAARRRGLDLRDAVRTAREGAPHALRVEVEVEDLDQVREALDAGADILLLDNMGLEQMGEAVVLAGGKAITEASGGITLENVRAVAATGVDLISVGALTHSVSALDISLELV